MFNYIVLCLIFLYEPSNSLVEYFLPKAGKVYKYQINGWGNRYIRVTKIERDESKYIVKIKETIDLSEKGLPEDLRPLPVEKTYHINESKDAVYLINEKDKKNVLIIKGKPEIGNKWETIASVIDRMRVEDNRIENKDSKKDLSKKHLKVEWEVTNVYNEKIFGVEKSCIEIKCKMPEIKDQSCIEMQLCKDIGVVSVKTNNVESERLVEIIDENN